MVPDPHPRHDIPGTGCLFHGSEDGHHRANAPVIRREVQVLGQRVRYVINRRHRPCAQHLQRAPVQPTKAPCRILPRQPTSLLQRLARRAPPSSGSTASASQTFHSENTRFLKGQRAGETSGPLDDDKPSMRSSSCPYARLTRTAAPLLRQPKKLFEQRPAQTRRRVSHPHHPGTEATHLTSQARAADRTPDPASDRTCSLRAGCCRSA